MFDYLGASNPLLSLLPMSPYQLAEGHLGGESMSAWSIGMCCVIDLSMTKNSLQNTTWKESLSPLVRGILSPSTEVPYASREATASFFGQLHQSCKGGILSIIEPASYPRISDSLSRGNLSISVKSQRLRVSQLRVEI